MQVVRSQRPDETPRATSSAPVATLAPRVPTQPGTLALPESGTAETQKAAATSANALAASVPAGTLPANVTFRRDEQGQIYYVLTDAQSGKEIREVPTAEIRKVGKGIADYLKQEATKNTSRVRTEA